MSWHLVTVVLIFRKYLFINRTYGLIFHVNFLPRKVLYTMEYDEIFHRFVFNIAVMIGAQGQNVNYFSD